MGAVLSLLDEAEAPGAAPSAFFGSDGADPLDPAEASAVKAFPPELEDGVCVVPRLDFGSKNGELVEVAAGVGWSVARVVSWDAARASCRWNLSWSDGRKTSAEIALETPRGGVVLSPASDTSGSPKKKRAVDVAVGETRLAVAYDRVFRGGFTTIEVRGAAGSGAPAGVTITVPTGQVGVALVADVLRFVEWATELW